MTHNFIKEEDKLFQLANQIFTRKGRLQTSTLEVEEGRNEMWVSRVHKLRYQ